MERDFELQAVLECDKEISEPNNFWGLLTNDNPNNISRTI